MLLRRPTEVQPDGMDFAGLPIVTLVEELPWIVGGNRANKFRCSRVTELDGLAIVAVTACATGGIESLAVCVALPLTVLSALM